MAKYKKIEWSALGNDPDDVVEVPAAEDMEDETFIRHIEARHSHEVKMEGGTMSRHAITAWIGSYRAFHGRLHKIAAPGQYDHEHEEPQ